MTEQPPKAAAKKPKGRAKKIETKTNISIHTHIHKGIFAHLSKISTDTGVSKQYLIEKALCFYFNLKTEKHRGKLIITTVNSLEDWNEQSEEKQKEIGNIFDTVFNKMI